MLLLCSLLVLLRGDCIAEPQSPTQSSARATLTADWVPGEKANVQFTEPAELQPRLVDVDMTAQAELTRANAKKGDVITAEVDKATSPTKVTAVDGLSRPTSVITRLEALIAAFVVLLFVACLVTNWKPGNFIVGLDNRFSNSQTQLALWFTAVATVYLATIALRVWFFGFGYVGGVSIPANLLTLTGLSALTFGAARIITTSKTNGVVKSPAGQPHLTDLVQNDQGKADIGDFQMLLFAGIAVVVFLVTSFHALGLVDAINAKLSEVDTTLLGLFGIGQGAYLVKKAGSTPGN